MKYYFAKLKEKRFYTYFITLINLNSYIRYISKLLFSKAASNVDIQPYNVYIYAFLVALCEILMCAGFIISYTNDFYNSTIIKKDEPVSHPQNIAKELSALKKGNLLKHQIYNFDYVSQVESSCIKGDEIWVITGDLEEDVSNPKLIKIIQDNLEKGVKYKYFVTKVANKITPSAKLGCEKLKQNHSQHIGKRLQYAEIDAELIAPDVDIIIYNATSLTRRSAYVCVEIGDCEESYSYQKLDSHITQQIIDELGSKYFSRRVKHTKNRNYSRNVFSALIIPFNIISFGFLSVISFSKISAIFDALCSIIPAAVLYFISILIIMGVDFLFSKHQNAIEIVNHNKNELVEVISEPRLLASLEEIKMEKQNDLFSQMQLGEVNKVLKVNKSCRTIWILSNLSQDIATSEFINWLEKTLDDNSHISCNILYTDGTDVVGRLSALMHLQEKFSDRIKTYPITKWDEYFLWSDTYGILFFENRRNNHEIYISLGKAEDSVYKKVIATEKQASTVLGILKQKSGTPLKRN